MNTHRMSCAEVTEKLPLFVGGDLDVEVLEAVRGHLDLCAECARRAGEASRARRALVAAFREVDPSRPELWSGIRSTLRAEGLIREPGKRELAHPLAQNAQRARSNRVRWGLLLTLMAAAAAILVVVQLGGFFAWPSNKALPRPEVAPGFGATQGVAFQPLSSPRNGTLQNVPPTRDPIVLMPYRARSQRTSQSVEGGISAVALDPRLK